MSDLYIQVQNGTVVDHPVFQQNLLDVFGSIPDYYQPFTRILMPNYNTIGVFQKIVETYETPNYQLTDGVWHDTWTVIDMTAEEKAKKIAEAQSIPQIFPSWSFDADTCKWTAPVPMPTSGGPYAWNEVTQTWALAPTTDIPEVGGPYAWNLSEQRWVSAPQDSNTYAWAVVTQTWVAKPTDGEYAFNNLTQQWVTTINPPTPVTPV